MKKKFSAVRDLEFKLGRILLHRLMLSSKQFLWSMKLKSIKCLSHFHFLVYIVGLTLSIEAVLNEIVHLFWNEF